MENSSRDSRAAFSAQARRFNEYQSNAFKTSFTQEMVNDLCLERSETVLEVAAGGCALGRVIAPFAARVTEMDVSREMLAPGEAANREGGVRNASYVVGDVEAMPFPNASFDVAASRLAFHHFPDPEKVMREMARVLKPGGKAAVMDMVPPDESARDASDRLERLRDPSHVRCLTPAELTALAEMAGLRIISSGSETVPLDPEAWLAPADPDGEARRRIAEAIGTDLGGGPSSGMSPFRDGERIVLRRRWVYFIAKKPAAR